MITKWKMIVSSNKTSRGKASDTYKKNLEISRIIEVNKNGIKTSVVRGVNNIADDNNACFIAATPARAVVGGTSVYDIIARHSTRQSRNTGCDGCSFLFYFGLV